MKGWTQGRDRESDRPVLLDGSRFTCTSMGPSRMCTWAATRDHKVGRRLWVLFSALLFTLLYLSVLWLFGGRILHGDSESLGELL